MEKINKAPKLYTHEGYDTVPKSLASKSDFLPSYLLAQQQGALTSQDLDNALIDRVSSLEIYELLYKITDPEYPYTLGQLNVVNLHDIKVQYGDQPSATGGGCCGSCNCSNKKEGVEMKGMNSSKDEYSGSEGGVGLDTIEVTFTPTVPHCSMATLIGLCIRVCLLRSMVDKFKVR
ncbi:MIP18 family protein [Zancudomyces culisetae]|uniref:MIP18 family protein n=1 Tax=Zancudomyces culisetae TaxID=1213189 RepID=A0A1R1PWU3_ZANCU|nr:MIP18 family protein [Zancudomyces culisetae]|eukprot:OMH85431.1 MIP18 family protein [Zancudomyces culisetae]